MELAFSGGGTRPGKEAQSHRCSVTVRLSLLLFKWGPMISPGDPLRRFLGMYSLVDSLS